MSFCSNCGQKIQESLKFCGNCGTPNPNASQISVPASQSTSSNRVLKTNSGEDYPQDTSKPSPVKETEKVAPNFESQNEIIFNIAVGKQDKGKHSLTAVAQMIASGELDGQCRAWRKGMADWQTASEIPEIAAILDDAPPPITEDPPPLSRSLQDSQPVLDPLEPTRSSQMMKLFSSEAIQSLKTGGFPAHNGSGIIQSISQLTEIKIEDAAKIADGFWAYIADGNHYNRDGMHLIIPNFGTFFIRKIAARYGINPQTGERIKIKSFRRVSFKLSPSLDKEQYLRMHQGGASAIKVKKSSALWTHKWKGKGLRHLSRKRKIAVYVQELTGLSLVDISIGLDTLYRLILSQVFKRPVRFRGRGTFSVKAMPARYAINLQTGERMKIKASKHVTFKAGAYLKRNLIIPA
jgi:nucleoid DNA-binding protein